jgi:cobalt-zinc-cadmium efflux system membrane fusion protein
MNKKKLTAGIALLALALIGVALVFFAEPLTGVNPVAMVSAALKGQPSDQTRSDERHDDETDADHAAHEEEEGHGPDHPEQDDQGSAHADDHGHTGEEHDEEGHGGHEEEEGHEEGMVHLPLAKREGMNLSLAKVIAGTVDGTLTVPAEIMLDPDNEAHIVPRVPGIVREVFVGIGDHMEEGDLLAVLESRELGRAKSEYLEALTMARLARTTFNREQELWKKEISAERDYLQARAELSAAEIKVQTAEQGLHALGLTDEEVEEISQAADTTLTRYEIRAPFAATVVERHIALGESVGEDDELFFVAKLDPVWIMGRATERDLRRLNIGQKAIVRLDALPEQDFSGTVDYLGSVLDTRSRTLPVRVVLSNPERKLRAGLFGSMIVFDNEHMHDPALLVPTEAIQRTEGGGIVYKAMGEEEFKAVPVSILHSSDSLTEVQGELAEGDRVAVGEVFILKSELGKESMGGGHSH